MDAFHISLEAGPYEAAYVSHIKTSHAQCGWTDLKPLRVVIDNIDKSDYRHVYTLYVCMREL